MNTYKNTSKFISLLLRHKPEIIDLNLDKHGWANVQELLEKMNNYGKSITFEILETIVNNDNKKRYSFNSDKTLIRANQGHSIQVDVELKKAYPPDYLWHGTADKFVDSIDENGLIPKTRLYVHLSEDYNTAINVGKRHGNPIVYKVLAKKMWEDGYNFMLSENNVWLINEVPKKYLEKQYLNEIYNIQNKMEKEEF